MKGKIVNVKHQEGEILMIIECSMLLPLLTTYPVPGAIGKMNTSIMVRDGFICRCLKRTDIATGVFTVDVQPEIHMIPPEAIGGIVAESLNEHIESIKKVLREEMNRKVETFTATVPMLIPSMED